MSARLDEGTARAFACELERNGELALETRTPEAATPGGLLDLSERVEGKPTAPAWGLQDDLAAARARVRAWLALATFCERRLQAAYDDLVTLEEVLR